MLRKRWVCFSSALAIAILSAGLWSDDAAPVNVVLVSWDGVDRSVLKELIEAGKVPNVAALAKEGSLRDIDVVGHQTETAPGHAQMLTALAPGENKVRTNTDYHAIPEGLTIFERVQKQLGGPDAINTILMTSKTGYMDGANPEEPYFLTRRHLTFFEAKGRMACDMGPACIDALGKYHGARFLAFFHFRDPDSNGHLYGSGSAQYRRGIVDCDEWLGNIVGWLKENKLYERTLVYVTCDHGFDPDARTHLHAPNAWLATNDKQVCRGGTQADIPATIMARFGIDLDKLTPKLIGADLAQPLRKPDGVPAPGR